MDTRTAQFEQIKKQMQILVNQPINSKPDNRAISDCLQLLVFTNLINLEDKLQLLKEVVSAETNVNFPMLLPPPVVHSANPSPYHAARQLYLNFMMAAVSEIKAPQVMSILEHKTKSGTFAMQVAQYEHVGDIRDYFNLLNSLLKQYIPASRLFDLETAQADAIDGKGTSAKVYRERFCDKFMRLQKKHDDLSAQYINWLNQLFTAGVSAKDLYDLLVTNAIHENSYHLHKTIKDNQSKATNKMFNFFLAKIVYTLLKTQEQLPTEHYQHLAFLKEAMHEYFKSLPERERLQASKDAINPDKGLGRLIHVPRNDYLFILPSRRKPRLDSGTLQKLSADIKQIESNQAKTKADFIRKIEAATKLNTTLAYTDILHEIMSSTLSAIDKLNVLSHQIDYAHLNMEYLPRQDSTIGMVVADCENTNDDCKAYLTFLNNLLAEVGEHRLFLLIERKNAAGYHFGLNLKQCQDAKLFEQYLDLLIKLQDKIPAKAFYEGVLCPQEIVEPGSIKIVSLGVILANLKSDACMEKYFQILSRLGWARLPPNCFYELFNKPQGVMHTQALRNFSAEMADKCPATMSLYLGILSHFIKGQCGLTADEVYNLLNVYDDNRHRHLTSSWSFAVRVAQNHDDTLIRQYLKLLVDLRTRGIPEQHIRYLLIQECGDQYGSPRYNFISLMINNHNSLLHELVSTDLLSDAEYERLRDQKDIILFQIMALDESKKEQALLDAADSNHPVGKLFWLTRDTKKEDAQDRHLRAIKAMLHDIKKQHEAAASVEQASPSPAAIDIEQATEDQSSLYPSLDQSSLYPSLADTPDTTLETPVAPPPYQIAHKIIVDSRVEDQPSAATTKNRCLLDNLELSPHDAIQNAQPELHRYDGVVYDLVVLKDQAVMPEVKEMNPVQLILRHFPGITFFQSETPSQAAPVVSPQVGTKKDEAKVVVAEEPKPKPEPKPEPKPKQKERARLLAM